MKLSVFDPVLASLSFEEMLAYLSKQGVDCVELGAGGYPGTNHIDPAQLLANPDQVKQIKELLNKYNMTISALSCHGNAVHPKAEVAKKFHDAFNQALQVAELLEVSTIVGFSGCPGDCPTSQHPNWVTCPWPDDFLEVLDYQWNDVLIPYWSKQAAVAKSHGVTKIAFEMHPGFCVYNPETTLKMRAAVGDVIGANLDPSHLFWQGIDPIAAAKSLQGAIYHFHAKDTAIDKYNTAVNGVLDTKHYGDLQNRSWVFRTVGYGHGKEFWNDMISMLRVVGYDGAISIEHEDALMSPTEGLEKAIAFLKEVLIYQSAGDMWWA